ncbi:hypothetical protein R7D97_16180 [Vibrio sp. Vb5031]|uniref:Uncharacterized protein n=2 Tax=Vibrio TaxID=662 RepID=A0A1B1LRR6_VIBPH|nr:MULTISPECIES: hypothetical protein [Vibrio]ANS55743.1 hypothetical protein [Vibrio parahaemolyticus]EJL6490345.1 hypothetical protein [Vibrio cholerae]EJL6642035.1 hypothetical protein [Vibrio cholerae]MBL4244502.1 hypothetical protein [Vibrio fluvialis]MBL4253392.1 hypothetical protein [Vibrio fluvialis]
MINESITGVINIKGIIPQFALKEFDADGQLEEASPEDMISLISSVTSEFGEGGLRYSFNPSGRDLQIKVVDLDVEIQVSNLSQHIDWDLETKSDFLLLRSVMPKHLMFDSETVMAMNEAHPNIKLYLKNERLVIEEAYYLSYGVSILNLMDRLSAYLNTLSTVE